MEEFKAIDADNIIVDGKEYRRTAGLTQGCGGCAFNRDLDCYVECDLDCKGYDIWERSVNKESSTQEKTQLS